MVVDEEPGRLAVQLFADVFADLHQIAPTHELPSCPSRRPFLAKLNDGSGWIRLDQEFASQPFGNVCSGAVAGSDSRSPGFRYSRERRLFGGIPDVCFMHFKGHQRRLMADSRLTAITTADRDPRLSVSFRQRCVNITEFLGIVDCHFNYERRTVDESEIAICQRDGT
jgi:hypothetical protein